MLMPELFDEKLFNDFMDDPFDDRLEKKLEKELLGRNKNRRMKRWMRADIKELDDSFEVQIELPGFKKNEVTVQLQYGYLTVSAVKGLDKEDEGRLGRYIRRERFAGALRRSFYVGDSVQEADVKAKFKRGILKLTIPKKESRPMVEDNNEIVIE